jgi:uncharacterized protein (TIGR01777 family)
MDYLITGATGFIGHHLVARLLQAGNEVNYLGRKRSRTLDSRAAFHLWIPGERPPIDSVPTVDAVIHLAGEPVAQRWNEAVKGRIYASRVDSTRRLVAALAGLRHKPSILISASATGYYGNRGDEMLTETSPAGDDYLANVCVEWEREAMRAAEFGLRVVLVRIAPVLGRGGGILSKMLPPFRLGLGGKLGSGRQWMPWIHLNDLMELLLFAVANRNVKGALNGSVPEPVTNAEFTRALARAVHRPALFKVPLFALRLALGEAAAYMVSSQRVLPKAAEDTGFRFQYPHLDNALEDLTRGLTGFTTK